MRISEINNANVIILNDDLFNAVINKQNHSIIQTRILKSFERKDVTKECEKIECEYTIGDIVIDAPYKLGMIASRMLNNRTDKKCLKTIKKMNIELTTAL